MCGVCRGSVYGVCFGVSDMCVVCVSVVCMCVISIFYTPYPDH